MVCTILETNVVISSLLFGSKNPSEIVASVTKNEFEFVICDEVEEEYRRKLDEIGQRHKKEPRIPLNLLLNKAIRIEIEGSKDTLCEDDIVLFFR